jgi:branched-chain amino acid transport system substrate-binding protein
MLAWRATKLFCLLGFLVVSPSAFAASIKIGDIHPLTGRLATHGLESHQGVVAAVVEVNEAGGILGRQVDLVSRDDQSLPDVAISRAEELCAREKVVGLTGGYEDSLVGAVSEVARKYQVPFVASASIQKELARHGNPFFFRVARLQGFVEPLCDFLSERLRPQRLAILHAATPGATEFAADLERCLQPRGIPVRLGEKFRPGTPDFVPLIAKLATLPADVIVSGGFFADHILMVRQLREQRLSPKAYIGPWGVAYETFLEEMGEDAEHIYGTSAWMPGITLSGTEAASRAFVERCRRLFKREPSSTTMHGYTAARALLAAIDAVLRRSQPLTGANVRQALAGLDLLLPMERLSFDERGDPRSYRHVVVQVQGGRFVVVYPPERANGSAVYPAPPWKQRP